MQHIRSGYDEKLVNVDAEEARAEAAAAMAVAASTAAVAAPTVAAPAVVAPTAGAPAVVAPTAGAPAAASAAAEGAAPSMPLADLVAAGMSIAQYSARVLRVGAGKQAIEVEVKEGAACTLAQAAFASCSDSSWPGMSVIHGALCTALTTPRVAELVRQAITDAAPLSEADATSAGNKAHTLFAFLEWRRVEKGRRAAAAAAAAARVVALDDED